MLSSPNTEFSPKEAESSISHDNLVESKYKNNNNDPILGLERKIKLAKGQEKVDLLVKNAKIDHFLDYLTCTNEKKRNYQIPFYF